MFKQGKLTFRTAKERTCGAGVLYVKCKDQGDAPSSKTTIWVCSAFFGDAVKADDRPAVIVHEILHLLGADERAAYHISPVGVARTITCSSCA